jgi:hypothetical protein
MVTVLEECTTEKQLSVVRFCGQKDPLRRIFIKKYFLFMVGSICRVKGFTTGPKNSLTDEEVEMEVQKRLRQKSKEFYAAGFEALVKGWDKCISVGG